MTVRRPWLTRIGILIILAAVAESLPFLVDAYWTRIATGMLMWAGLALAWNVIGGYAGYISFGHAAFFGVGAYATGLLMRDPLNIPFAATLPAGIVAAGTLAVLIGLPTLRLRGAYFAIATWASAEVLFQVATVADFTGGTSGMTLPGFVDERYFYNVMLVATAVTYAVCYVLLERSRFGLRVKAVRDNEMAAQSLGINTTAVKLQAFVLSAVIPAAFGGIYAYWITFINPQSVLAGNITDQMVVMALLGGLGHPFGPVLGAGVLYMVNRTFWASSGNTTAYIAILGVVIGAVVLFLPDGLVSLWPRQRRTQLARKVLGQLVKPWTPTPPELPSERPAKPPAAGKRP